MMFEEIKNWFYEHRYEIGLIALYSFIGHRCYCKGYRAGYKNAVTDMKARL